MILVAGFVSWDPNLILSAAFTPEHLGMDFFWRRSRACWMRTYFCFSKMINGKNSTIQITTSSSLCKKPDTKPKSNPSTPICTTHSHSVGAWTAMFSEALHMRPSWELRYCGKASNLHLSLFVSLQKRRFRSTVSYAIWFYCSVVPRCFYLSNKPYVVITPWPWCPTCNFNMSQLQSLKKISPLFPVAKAGQVEMHFADLQTLATVLLWHRNTVHPLT